MPYLSALEVCSRRGAIQIDVYLPTYLPAGIHQVDTAVVAYIRIMLIVCYLSVLFGGRRGSWLMKSPFFIMISKTFLPVDFWECNPTSFLPGKIGQVKYYAVSLRHDVYTVICAVR